MDLFDEPLEGSICGGSDIEPQNPIIGTLGEGGVHRFLKDYYAPDPACQEQPVLGFVADAVVDGQIIEIQSHQLRLLRPKLTAYLSAGYLVRVVYPVRQVRYAAYLQADGVFAPPKRIAGKSPLPNFLAELYGIWDLFLPLHKASSRDATQGRLMVDLVCLEVEELRTSPIRSRAKKGEKRLLGVEVKQMISCRSFYQPRDFLDLFKTPLPACFTVKELAAVLKTDSQTAGIYARLLCHWGLAKRERNGRGFVYTLLSNFDI